MELDQTTRRMEELEDKVFKQADLNTKIKAENSLVKQELAFTRIDIESMRSEINRLTEANRKLSEGRHEPIVSEPKVDPFEFERVELKKEIEELQADNARLRKEVLVGAEVAPNAKKWHHIEVGEITIDLKENYISLGVFALVVLLTFYLRA